MTEAFKANPKGKGEDTRKTAAGSSEGWIRQPFHGRLLQAHVRGRRKGLQKTLAPER